MAEGRLTGLEGWAYYDGCVVCPHCNAFTSCENEITKMLEVIPLHRCGT